MTARVRDLKDRLHRAEEAASRAAKSRDEAWSRVEALQNLLAGRPTNDHLLYAVTARATSTVSGEDLHRPPWRLWTVTCETEDRGEIRIDVPDDRVHRILGQEVMILVSLPGDVAPPDRST